MKKSILLFHLCIFLIRSRQRKIDCVMTSSSLRSNTDVIFVISIKHVFILNFIENKRKMTNILFITKLPRLDDALNTSGIYIVKCLFQALSVKDYLSVEKNVHL